MGKNKRKRSHTRHVFVQKKYRDALFRRIFNERSVLLELYNALNRTSYDDADELIFFTIDDVIYFGKQYESYIKQNNLNIYGKKLLKLPFPQFVIFYNGIEPLENGKDYMELHLSDAFDYESKAVNGRPCLEYTARIYNINYGHNQELITRCRTLEEYSILISRISSKVRSGASLEQAADTAVLECIKDGILKDFLTKHRSEVVGMLLEEFDMDEYIKMERRDSYEDGLSESLSQSHINGEYSHRIHTVYNMFHKNIPVETCANLLNEDISFVNKIYLLCQTHAEWSEDTLKKSLSEK